MPTFWRGLVVNPLTEEAIIVFSEQMSQINSYIKVMELETFLFGNRDMYVYLEHNLLETPKTYLLL